MSEEFWRKYYPLTASMGFIKVNFNNLVDEYTKWIKKIPLDKSIEIVDGNLDLMIEKLKPFVMPHTKCCFLQTESEWVAYFDNGTYGPDPFPPVTYMAKILNCEAVTMGFSENTIKSNIGRGSGTYGSTQFVLYSPESKEFLYQKRAIIAANDGGRWTFISEGDPLPFEDTNRYSAKRILERFDRPMLESYCSALGIEIYNEEFYGNKFMLACSLDRS